MDKGRSKTISVKGSRTNARISALNKILDISIAFFASFLLTILLLFVFPVEMRSREFFSYFMLGLFLGLFVFLVFLLLFLRGRKERRRRKILTQEFPQLWRDILENEVLFYRSLDKADREIFEKRIKFFLAETKISGIGLDVDERTRVFIAASALIPVFSFPDLEYNNLGEVLVYPSGFDENFQFQGKRKDIIGMVVGQSSTMILSQPALLESFTRKDAMHVGIHEFIHKIDEMDGEIDGIPALIMDAKTAFKWKKIMDAESEKIREGKSDINPYALSDDTEFFSVVSEYFFDSPGKMREKHPELYRILKKIFRQDLALRYRQAFGSILSPSSSLSRKMLRGNAKCPCGSGKRYKDCCGPQKRSSVISRK